jgi:predicted amidohydrolase YtcJ
MCAAGRLLRDVEVDGRRVDVRIRAGVVVEVEPQLPPDGDQVIAGAGGSLLPGLHDHHLHLFAIAAAVGSVDCGAAAGLAGALGSAEPRAGWVRGIGYDDGVSGDLDRWRLDQARADVPVRVQHRSGALWVLNSAGVAAVGLAEIDESGVERDESGRVTGRLWRMDRWLREQLGPLPLPDLDRLSARLAALGITGVTDATPDLDEASVAALTSGALKQSVTLLGDRGGSAPWKVVVEDHDLPAPAVLADQIAAIRPRPVALHCVSRVALVVALSALAQVGTVRGDRIEHAAVCPPELTGQLAAAGIVVVTQPSLIARRGDDYFERVEQDDLDVLWPYASLLAGGVGVGASSDAPYGDLDPWASIAAATERTTSSGRVLGAAERVDARTALAGYLSDPLAPGGPPRPIAPGSPADLVLLDRPLAEALRAPAAEHVRTTFIAGEPVFDSGRPT